MCRLLDWRGLVGDIDAVRVLLASFGLLVFAGGMWGATVDELNAAFGVPIWESDSLWEEEPAKVAARLGWPQESATSNSQSYRQYPPASAKILEARPFSLALYGEDGKVDSISMVFANKGDVDAMVEVKPGTSDLRARQAAERIYRDYGRFIRADTAAIRKALTDALGEPTSDRFGESRDTRERVLRWDWQGHAILLASPRDEYVAVRILPTAVADGGQLERVSNADMREKLAARVLKRPNGDVILQDVPMVNQGPKGYCVPATWERALRYMGIPADMYVLAMAGSTDTGGGTSTRAIAMGVDDLVRRHGRKLSHGRGRIDIRTVAREIDRGLPLMWTMFSLDMMNERLHHRLAQRVKVDDWEAWSKSLDPYRRSARQIKRDKDRGHVCMIIGYNAATGEVAVSDSWGPQFAERWMSVEEAEAVSQGGWTIVDI